MLRTAIVLLITVIAALLMLPVLLVMWIISLFRPDASFNGAMGRLAHIFLPPLLKLAGVRFEVTGRENLPDDAAAVYAGNHQGGFDAVVPLLFLGSAKSIVMKKEISKIPLAGCALRLFGCIFLDRTDLRAQVACIREMEDRLKSGKSIAIFPEGTRSKGPDMGEFKAGAIRAAIAAQVPVVPFVIDGSWHCYEEQHRLVPHTVQLSILPPFPTEGLKPSDAKETAAQIRELMQKEQTRLRAEKGTPNA